jgi:hypothetical protein
MSKFSLGDHVGKNAWEEADLPENCSSKYIKE